jgi:predicted site-specific integrase-resolvase
MSLTKTWYTIDEAVSKYGLSTKQIQKWIDEGLVRTEEGNGKVTLINGDDIELELGLIPSA